MSIGGTDENCYCHQKLDGSTLLHVIVQKRPPRRTLEKLLMTGAIPINSADNLTRNTPLHYAASENAQPEIVRLLLAHGADVNFAGYVCPWTAISIFVP